MDSELLKKLQKIRPGMYQDSKSMRERLNELKLQKQSDLRNWALLQDE